MRTLILAAALALPVPAFASAAKCEALGRTVERMAAFVTVMTDALEACGNSQSAVCDQLWAARQSMMDDGLLDPETFTLDGILMTDLSIDICD